MPLFVCLLSAVISAVFTNFLEIPVHTPDLTLGAAGKKPVIEIFLQNLFGMYQIGIRRTYCEDSNGRSHRRVQEDYLDRIRC